MAAEHESWFDCWVGVVLPALRASLSVVWRLTTGELGRACHLPYVDIDTFFESRPTLLSSQACALIKICLSSDIDKQSIGRPFDFG